MSKVDVISEATKIERLTHPNQYVRESAKDKDS